MQNRGVGDRLVRCRPLRRGSRISSGTPRRQPRGGLRLRAAGPAAAVLPSPSSGPGVPGCPGCQRPPPGSPSGVTRQMVSNLERRWEYGVMVGDGLSPAGEIAPAAGMGAADNLQLLRHYEPVLRFPRGELFLPMPVEGYLGNCSLWRSAVPGGAGARDGGERL